MTDSSPLDKAAKLQIKQLENKIQAQALEIVQLKSILDNLPGSIYWKDTHGVYLGRNEYAAQTMAAQSSLTEHTDKNSIVGKTDYDFFSEEIANIYRENDREVMEKGIELVKEEIHILPSGEQYVQLSSKRPLKNETGQVIGIVGNTVDISYLKKIEAELNKAKREAESANQVKTEFIRNMEHDIRTPFNGIWGLSHYLWQKETDVEKKNLLGDITNSAKELLDYCNGILDFSRIELGSLAIENNKFDVKGLMESLLKVEMPAATNKNLALELEYDDSIPVELIGDAYRLYRILINLLSNAIKFTATGYVKLTVKTHSRFDTNGIKLLIQVKDTGIGIPADKQSYIYEKFSKISPSNQNAYKGIGLGLVIVKKFIAELNGEVTIKSEPLQGSLFNCIIPFITTETVSS